MASEYGLPIVGIGASAGGVAALQLFFEALPDEPNAAFVVIIHLAPELRSQLAGVLATRTVMPVTQVDGRAKLENNNVYVIAPNSCLVLTDHHISAEPLEEPRAKRAPIDWFFRSLAEQHSDGVAYAIILTGAGTDGTIGVKSIKGSGGIVLVQDPAEAEYPSMPNSAIAAEVADFVLPIRGLADKLVELLKDRQEGISTPNQDNEEDTVRRILAHLRVRIGHDFSLYKRATILRRIGRRLQVTRKSLKHYLAYLRDTPEEAQALFADFLISVTTFFRDHDAFRLLAQDVIPRLFEERGADSTIRVWVPGCATGEEAYTIGMLLLEEAGRRDLQPEIHVFGSDLDAGALSVAREGRFPATIEADVMEERLQRFFQREGDHYRVRRELRDIMLFAGHNVLRDPPFSRLDLISCRNLLIYLDRELQHQLCKTFHYALNAEGFLFLGASESADSPDELFTPVDRDARIFRAVAVNGPKRATLPILLGPRQQSGAKAAVPRGPSTVTVGDAALHRRMLERIAPPSMLVDASYRAVHLSESAGRFLQMSGGPVTTDATDMVREELRFDLRSGLHRAFEHGEPTLSLPLLVRFDGAQHRVYLQIKPVLQDKDPTRYALILFIEGEVIGPDVLAGRPGRRSEEVEVETVRQMQEELQLAHNRLRTTREESEAGTEELRGANEELQSLNEEYRSTSEELETSKEELQSINEELQTVNSELKLKLESVSRAHSDLQNLMAATDFGTLFLDLSLCIKRFTPRLTELFNITAADEGRPVTDFTHQLDYSDLAAHARAVLKDLVPIEHEVQSRSGGWYLVRIRPYRTVDDRIDGVVATFVDITKRKRAEEALRESETRFRQFGAASSDILWIRHAETLRCEYLSPAFETIYGVSCEEALAGDTMRSWTNLIVPEDRERVIECIQRVRGGEPVTFEFRIRRPADGQLRWLRTTDFPMRDEAGCIVRVGGIGQNVTELKAIEAAIANSEARLRTLTEGIPQLVWRASNDGRWTWASPQWTAFTGQTREESLGMGWLDAIHPEERATTTQAWHDAGQHGRVDVEHRVRRAPDGAWFWHQTRSLPVNDAQGRTIEWVGTSTDTQHLIELQNSQAVMVAELQHRTRNLIAVVRSIAGQTMARTPSVATFNDVFNHRLEALARVQGLLSRSDEAPITIEALVRMELDALGAEHGSAGRVTLDGPPVRIRNSVVQTLALALHELATNARKYGALSTAHGWLTVRWHVRASAGPGSRLVVEWVETGGPALDATAASRRGYGRELIERALPYSLDATTQYELGEGGVRCTIDMPLERAERV